MEEIENERNSINFIEEEEKEIVKNAEIQHGKEVEASGTDYDDGVTPLPYKHVTEEQEDSKYHNKHI